MSNINMANLIQQAAWLIILAMGVTFVLLLGEIDLSIGATMGVTVAYVYTQTNSGVATWLSVVLAAIVGGSAALLIARQTQRSGSNGSGRSQGLPSSAAWCSRSSPSWRRTR